MNIKKAVAIRLLANDELKDIVADRIYRKRLPKIQETKPPHIIIWRLPGTKRAIDHDGFAGLTETMVQISCFSHDPDEVDTMRDLVIQSMESWPAEDDKINDAFIDDESDGFEDDTMIYHIPLDVKISYNE